MRRREFIGYSAAAIVGAAVPRAARAQQPGRIYRLGSLQSAPRDAPHHVVLFEKLRMSGFTEGQNLLVDWEGYGLRSDQFDEHAAALVRAGIDVIQAGGDAALRAAQKATAEIPIVALTDDMLGQGFVRSLAKPGGNTTGVSILASELDGKRQEMLIEAAPHLHRVAALADDHTSKPEDLRALVDAAHAKGIELSTHHVLDAAGIAPAIEAAHASGAEAVNVLASALFFNNRSIIFDRIAALHLPAIYQWPEMAHEGGLIGYGPSIVQLYRDVVSRQLTAVLRGARPEDLPIEQPTQFELVINLKTAKAIGLGVPPALLAQADEVIE